jgi:hypothetical protein
LKRCFESYSHESKFKSCSKCSPPSEKCFESDSHESKFKSCSERSPPLFRKRST